MARTDDRALRDRQRAMDAIVAGGVPLGAEYAAVLTEARALRDLESARPTDPTD
jgi:hypothetical protein